jgi:transcriptional regulator with XRE-family HTH domain
VQKNWKYKAYPQQAVVELAKRMKARWLPHKEATGMTQEEFAKILGITQPALNQFLNGTTPISNAMIILMCRELGVTPQEMVKGIDFFEPFFTGMITSRVVRVRYKIGATKSKETIVTGEAIQYHVHSDPETDVYAVEIADDVYQPRYFKGEKVIITAVTPQVGDECFIKLTDGKTCITRVATDDLICLKNIVCVGCADIVSIDDERIEFAHKVVGMSK